MAVIYKTLFEVKLQHEYFLTGADGKTIFESATQEERNNYLTRQYELGAVSVNEDLEFEFPPELLAAYGGYNLKLLPTYSGFKVAVRVNPVKLEDGSLVYKPLVTFPDQFCINILFSKKSRTIDSYTSSKINNPLPALYYFSNEKILSDKTSPFLTNSISAFNLNYYYEQGELVSFGNNDIRGYYLDPSGDQWNPFPGAGFASENDRLLLPVKFNYAFPPVSNVTQVEFILRSGNGDPVKTILRGNGTRISKTELDFSDKQDALIQPDPLIYRPGLFSLEVNGNNGYTRTHPIIFSGVLYQKNVWAVAQCIPSPENADFRLLDQDGYLIMRTTTSGKVGPRMFEIPVKSRYAYWRFINDSGKKLMLTLDLTGYLLDESGKLISARPKTISKIYSQFKREGTGELKLLPTPDDYDIKMDEQGRLLLDVMVPRSDLFKPV